MKSTHPRVTIMVPHYNHKECLQRHLPAVDNQTFRDLEVIIIDDRTPDQAAISFIWDLIKDRPNMHLVQNMENLRFVKTCSKGISMAKGEYICLLNQDTEIKSTFVEKNVTIMDSDAGVGALSCLVLDQHGHNWFSGGEYRRGFPINLTDDFLGVRSVDFLV